MKALGDPKPASLGDQTLNSGIFHLLVHLSAPKRLGVGNPGIKHFPSGYYIYTGSAKRNLAQRLERHLRTSKTLRWHIDYLTVVAAIEKILVHRSKTVTECGRANAILKLSGGEVNVPRFGSSDCKCTAHLVYFQTKPFLDSGAAWERY